MAIMVRKASGKPVLSKESVEHAWRHFLGFNDAKIASYHQEQQQLQWSQSQQQGSQSQQQGLQLQQQGQHLIEERQLVTTDVLNAIALTGLPAVIVERFNQWKESFNDGRTTMLIYRKKKLPELLPRTGPNRGKPYNVFMIFLS